MLALITDLYTPLLAGVTLFINRQQWRIKIKPFLLYVAVVYTIFFLDRGFEWFTYFGLDYSTHLAFVLVFLMFMLETKSRFVLTLVSIVGYAILMMMLKYHALSDLAVTSVVVLPLFYGVALLKVCRL